MNCPKCSSADIQAYDVVYSVVTINPTALYADKVAEQSCGACNLHWFSAPEETTPQIMIPTVVITNIDGGSFDPQQGELTLGVNTSFVATGELRIGGAIYTPYNGVFRMPIASLDGREKLILAHVVNGVVTINWTPTDSGIWSITSTLLNRDIPPEQHVSFTGLKIFVID